jgi:DNA polymerase III delta subunit
MALKMQVYTGSDTTGATDLWKAECKIAGTNERVNVSEHPGTMFDAINSPPLFGSARIIAADLDGISDAELESLISSAPNSDAIVVARMTEVSSSQRKLIEKIAKIISLSIPQTKDLSTRLEKISHSSGVHLTAETRSILIERSGNDIDRIRSVIEQCRLGHLLEPTIRQLNVLLGSSERGALPWDVSDAIDRNDLLNAVDIALECEPIALVAYLSNRYLEAAKVRESSETPDVDLAVVITGQSRWQAERTTRLACKIDLDGFGRRLRSLAEADRLLKTNKDSASVIGELINTLII